MNYDNEKTTDETAQTVALSGVGMGMYETFAVQLNWTVTTPTAKTFGETDTDTGDNAITVNAHGYKTGLKVRLTSTGTLPSPLATSTDYFVIVVDENTIQLATSLNNANSGTAVTLSDDGSTAATHTITATALAGASVKLQESADGANWSDISGATDTITTTAGKLMQYATKCAHVRPHLTMTAGQVSLQANWNKKG